MSVKVVFHLEYFSKPNETIAMVGSLRELGVWKPRKAVFGVEKEGGRWEAVVVVPRDMPFQFKWIVIDRQNNNVIRWEERDNRTMEISKSAQVYTTWNFGHEILDSEDKQGVDEQEIFALAVKVRDWLHHKGNRNFSGPCPIDAGDNQNPFDKCARDMHQPAFAKDLNKVVVKNAEDPNTTFAKGIIEHAAPVVMLLMGMSVELGLLLIGFRNYCMILSNYF